MKTDGEAQLESLAAVINEEEADALFIVGGDGTVDRVITGIFRGDSQAAGSYNDFFLLLVNNKIIWENIIDVFVVSFW